MAIRIIIENKRRVPRGSIPVAQISKLAIVRAFEMVQETASTAGYSTLGKLASKFINKEKNHKVDMQNLRRDTVAIFKPEMFDEATFSRLMPKTIAAKGPPTPSRGGIKPQLIAVNQYWLKARLQSILGTLNKDAVAVKGQEQPINNRLLIELMAIMLTPVIAHEIDHYRFHLAMAKGFFSSRDVSRGAKHINYHINDFIDLNINMLKNPRRTAALEKSGVSVMSGFQKASKLRYINAVIKAWPSSGPRTPEMIEKLIDDEFKKQKVDGAAYIKSLADNLKNLSRPPTGWEQFYDPYMSKKDK